MTNSPCLLVFGLNRSGLGAVRLLSVLGQKALLWDDNEQVRKSFSVPSGMKMLSRGPVEALDEGVSLAVISPGISPENESVLALKSRGISIISEVELAYRHCDSRILAVTGTNGKSSAVTILHTLLEHEGESSILAGNIGIPFSSVLADVLSGQVEKPDWYVLEVSSYQLELCDTFKPEVAVYTSYAPDHLDWHGSEEAYVEAKVSMARRLTEGDSLVFPEDCGLLSDSLHKVCVDSKASVVLLKDKGEHCSFEGNDNSKVLDPGHRGMASNPSVVDLVPDSGELIFKGQGYNLYHLLREASFSPSLVSCALHATLGAAAAMKMNMASIVKGLMEFTPLEHRLEDIGTVGSIRFINDSKATNIDATSYALRMCCGPVVLLLGGKHKGVSYKELIPFFSPSLKLVVAYGEARNLIVTHLTGEVPVRCASSFEEALSMAVEEASRITLPASGTMPVVLLSPACSSFDMFSNFEERGDAFKKWVHELRGRTHNLLDLDDGHLPCENTSIMDSSGDK